MHCASGDFVIVCHHDNKKDKSSHAWFWLKRLLLIHFTKSP